MHSSWLGRAIGGLTLFACLVFIAIQVWSFRDQLVSWQPTLAQFASLPAGVLIYAVACVPLAAAWKTLLLFLEGRVCGPDRVSITYARSQIGKYLPGNVAHIAGRHVILSGHGYTNQALVLSALYEILGLLSAAGLISSVALAFSEAEIFTRFPLIYTVPLLAFALPAWYLLHRFAPMILDSGPFRSLAERVNANALLFLPYVYYTLFFLLAGNALVLLTWASGSPVDANSYLVICLAFSVSWTLGFLTPGAPSGIGVREAVLVYILSPVAGAPQAIIIAALFRLVTVGGDLLFWLLMEARMRYLKPVL